MSVVCGFFCNFALDLCAYAHIQADTYDIK